jgi:hypothetical protein
LVALVPLLIAVGAATANADTRTLGQIAPTSLTGGCTACTEWQKATDPMSPSFSVPAGSWTITSWASHGGSIDTPVRLRVFRSGPGVGQYTLVAESSEVTIPAASTAPVATSLPVQAGDMIGLRTGSGGNLTPNYTGLGGDFSGTVLGDPVVGDTACTPGSTFTGCGGSGGTLINVAATISGSDPPSGSNTSPPSNSFSVAQVKRDQQKGTATLSVDVPGPGILDLSGKSVKSQRAARIARAIGARPVAAAGTVVLKVKAKGKARRKLRKTGKAKVKLSLTYTPTGGQPKIQTLHVKLVRTGRHS